MHASHARLQKRLQLVGRSLRAEVQLGHTRGTFSIGYKRHAGFRLPSILEPLAWQRRRSLRRLALFGCLFVTIGYLQNSKIIERFPDNRDPPREAVLRVTRRHNDGWEPGRRNQSAATKLARVAPSGGSG